MGIAPCAICQGGIPILPLPRRDDFLEILSQSRALLFFRTLNIFHIYLIYKPDVTVLRLTLLPLGRVSTRV